MIDSHCHLEQHDYDKDRDEVISECKKAGLKAIVTCCAHPRDFELTMQMIEKHRGFVFATVGIHPEYIKEISEKEVQEFFETIRRNKDKIVAIGEVGLDFWHQKERIWQDKQKHFFIRFIELANELDKPLIVHSRGACGDVIELLEKNRVKKAHLHMFESNYFEKNIIDNKWVVSVNTMISRSKKFKKVARDIPINNLMSETDSPWLGSDGNRNTPLSVRLVIESLAKIKKMSIIDVDTITTSNAIKFFGLPI